MVEDKKIKGAADLISTLPDVILQHILCFISTKLAISTSLLSRRWRHVWCDIPSISLDANTLTAASVNKTLNRYTARKTKSFHLKSTRRKKIHHVNRWIKCALSHNVENLSLDFWSPCNDDKHKLPDFFYNSSSVKQLDVSLSYSHRIVPECTVSWTSLQKLSLSNCTLFDQSLAKILSGCPVLENLTLYQCDELKVIDLSKSKRLRTLQIERNVWVPGPTQIVAPHIHCLRLLNSQLSCTFVDIASLIEAKLDICYVAMFPNLNADFLQGGMVLKMLEKLQNADKLTFGGDFIQILSLAEIRGVPFPMLKVKSLTLHTEISQYVIPGIERLLQNSPDLEKLTVHRAYNDIPGEHLDQYLKLQVFNLNTCWRSKDGASWNKFRRDLTSEHLASLVKLMLKNAKKLVKVVVLLDELYNKSKIEDVVVPTLPRNKNVKNVNIVLSTTKLMESEKRWWLKS